MSVSVDDFFKIDIRAGTVIRADEFPEAVNPSFKLLIDFGELGKKKSSAQITEKYNVEDLPGTQVLAVVNFPPRQIANFMSEVLVLGIEEEDGVTLLRPDFKVDNGVRIS